MPSSVSDGVAARGFQQPLILLGRQSVLGDDLGGDGWLGVVHPEPILMTFAAPLIAIRSPGVARLGAVSRRRRIVGRDRASVQTQRCANIHNLCRTGSMRGLPAASPAMPAWQRRPATPTPAGTARRASASAAPGCDGAGEGSVNRPGPIRPASAMMLELAPCSWPCSDALTRRLIMPCALRRQGPTAPSPGCRPRTTRWSAPGRRSQIR